MRWKYIFHIIGILLLFLGLAMIFPILWGLYEKELSFIPLLKAMGIPSAWALFFTGSAKARKQSISPSVKGWPLLP